MRMPRGAELRTSAALALTLGLGAWDQAGFGLPLESNTPQDVTTAEMNLNLQNIEQPALVKFGGAIARFVRDYDPMTSRGALLVTPLPNGYEEVLIGVNKGNDSYLVDAVIDEVGAANDAPEATQYVQTDDSFKTGGVTYNIEDKVSQQGTFTAHNSYSTKTSSAPPTIKYEIDVPSETKPTKVELTPNDTEYIFTPDQVIELKGDAQNIVSQETQLMAKIFPEDK